VLLRDLLSHPLTRGLDIDDPKTTHLRRDIIREKPFLSAIYRDWYSMLAGALPSPPGAVLELGSGAGFLTEVIPEAVTSELFVAPFVKTVLDAHFLPFGPHTLRAVVMTNVLHHLREPTAFLADAARCVRPDGVVAMIEPWPSPWSRLVYTTLHHEPFDPRGASSLSVTGGPLSTANGALPWILFTRDRIDFERTFPYWNIESIKPVMPIRYLLSGGVSLRTLMPGWTTGFWRGVERAMEPAIERFAMFALIVLRRRPAREAPHVH